MFFLVRIVGAADVYPGADVFPDASCVGAADVYPGDDVFPGASCVGAADVCPGADKIPADAQSPSLFAVKK